MLQIRPSMNPRNRAASGGPEYSVPLASIGIWRGEPSGKSTYLGVVAACGLQRFLVLHLLFCEMGSQAQRAPSSSTMRLVLFLGLAMLAHGQATQGFENISEPGMDFFILVR
ncbi:hypothetical protein F751_5698 [Auxenochlorella protothecoides]|uniref:Uncharacterized protein n=1 Tax=Auxenochlorella protothecoides TaxID=3075 RepID=A0A087SMX5_AUXPR|nr:hypothetical protein F751_5698 [Auxenochlorella protothecoides]KFM27079.1 hypothetical protein F751_5698 [Auxenochlorella protothecoides]